MLTRLQKRRAAEAAATAALTESKSENTNNKATSESSQVSVPESDTVVPSTSSQPNRVEEPNLVTVVEDSNLPSMKSDDPPPPVVSDNERVAPPSDELSPRPLTPPEEEEEEEKKEEEIDPESSRMDDETYYYKRDTRPSKIFKQQEAVTFEFITHDHSRDVEVEITRFRKTFQRFIKQLFEETSGFRRGVKIHVSALATYLVIKDGEVVDSPSFYINTRARTFLSGDDDQEATIDEILSSILEQSVDIIDRYIFAVHVNCYCLYF